MGTPLDTVNDFYRVTLENPDENGLEGFMAPDVRFVGPLQETEGAAAYIELNLQLLPFHAGTRMRAQFEAGDEVCSIYDMDLRTPAGDTLTLKLADWITVTDGKITAQTIYYDPREFAQAFPV